MKIRTLLLILVLSLKSAISQDVYENKQFGIKITKPTGWIVATNQVLQSNLDKMEFTDEQMIKLLNSSKGVVDLYTCYKYPIDKVSGLIPTAKFTIRANPTTNYTQFKKIIIANMDRVKTVVKDFELIESYKDTTISKSPTLYYSSRYSINLAGGGDMKVRNRYYVIPKGKYYISISLMDNEKNEDCSAVYKQLISSLQLTK